MSHFCFACPILIVLLSISINLSDKTKTRHKLKGGKSISLEGGKATKSTKKPNAKATVLKPKSKAPRITNQPRSDPSPAASSSVYKRKMAEVRAAQQKKKRENGYLKKMQKQGQLDDAGGDGDCFFKVLALHYYGDADSHIQVRAEICDSMAANRGWFGGFFAPDPEVDDDDDDDDASWDSYVARMRIAGTYSGNT